MRANRSREEVVFRADAAFSKPKIYAALEERDIKYAIRLPANNNLQRNITELLTPAGGEAELQTGGLVQELPLSVGQTTDRAAASGEGRVSLRGIVPPVWALS